MVKSDIKKRKIKRKGRSRRISGNRADITPEKAYARMFNICFPAYFKAPDAKDVKNPMGLRCMSSSKLPAAAPKVLEK